MSAVAKLLPHAPGICVIG